jgi:hypothetical protein
MDFTQRKLTKAEWDSIEVPLAPTEQHICELIIKGFHEVNLAQNHTKTLLHFMKITNTPQIDKYLYEQYFFKTVTDLVKKANLPLAPPMEVAKELSKGFKKADLIRLANTDRQIKEQMPFIFEFVLLDLLKDLLKAYSKKATKTLAYLFPLFTLQALLRYKIDINATLRAVLQQLLAPFLSDDNLVMSDFLKNGYELIEKNDYLLKYADETLYEHQKQLFSICKQAGPKLILYIAPTGTGKTLSPLGLSENKRVIFVCAARHVGLALAKAAISCHKKVAFAFGCQDAEDIRLHYFAAKEYTKNKKSGGIGKVDNTQGEKVEIIISDIQSYLPAMYYLLAFNKAEDVILYWDEPTISLDYSEHEFHAIIQQNWTQNLVPNVVLSSATLPHRNELGPTISDFLSRFLLAQVHDIVSFDCKKTIPLINRDGYVEMPHYLSTDYMTEILPIVGHCLKHKTLLRYLDLGEALKFVQRINISENCLNGGAKLAMDLHFPTLEYMTMANLKEYYLTLLGQIVPAQWSTIYAGFMKDRQKRQQSNINLVTTDAHTLTDGPTIFLAEDVNKMGQFYIESANIPPQVMQDILATIKHNRKLNEKVFILQKEYEDGTKSDEGKEKKQSKIAGNDADRLKGDPNMKRLKQEIDATLAQLKSIALNPRYVPNTRDHLYKYAPNASSGATNAFCSEVSEQQVEQLMAINDIDDSFKLLLLMGIGVFSSTVTSDKYTEIMKQLATEQKLYLIIASTDYIYGTNYQFCHGYIGKDLAHMSQEKCIQAMGRVGRNKLQQDYTIRFRDNTLLEKLFKDAKEKPEVENMRKLFNKL